MGSSVQRRLTPEQQKAVTESLSRAATKFKAPTIELVYSIQDLEARAYAQDFDQAIRQAGWNISPLRGGLTEDAANGVSVQFCSGLTEPATAVALSEALERAGVSFQRMVTIAARSEASRLVIGPAH